MSQYFEFDLIKKYETSSNFEFHAAGKLPNEITVIFGPSGSGKSTLIRLLAGLEIPDSGFIKIKNETVFDSNSKINLNIQKRKFGYLPQQECLFPQLNILQNVIFGAKHLSQKKSVEKALNLLHDFELSAYAKSSPQQISGGQRQRAALARTLISEPRMLLLDEPFSSLDQSSRIKMGQILLDIQKKYSIPVVIVTHDREEAFALAAHLIIMDQGKIMQQGVPMEVHHNTTNTINSRINELWLSRPARFI